MAYQIATQRIELDDGVSAAANAATAAMSKLADAGDVVEKSVTKVGQSASTLVNRLDPVTKSANALEAAQNKLAQAQVTLASAVANGSTTQDAANRTLDTLQQRVRAAQAAFGAAADPVNGLTKAVDAATVSHGQAGNAMTNLRIQAVQLFSGIATGQPIWMALIQQGHQVYDSLAATGQGMGALGAAARSMWGFVASPAGVITAAVAGLGLLAYSADAAQAKMLALSTTLRSTRDDYSAMATEATQAAKQVAATTGFSTSDASAAAKSIVAVPAFTGSTQQLASLIKQAGDLSAVLGISLPEAAQKFAVAMTDPGKAADDLANVHFKGMSDALARQITLQAQAGDTAGAFNTWLQAVDKTAQGAAAGSLTTIGTAMKRLSDAFTQAGADGRSLADVIGGAINSSIALAINTITALVDLMNKLRGLVSTSGPLPGASTGSVPGMPVVGPATSLSNDVLNQIYQIAEQKNFAGNINVSALQSDFATQIALQESGGHQFNASGGVLTSPKGAQGMFQLMPSTAASLGVNAADTAGNITGGLQYIAQLWSKYGGDPRLVAMAYNWGPGFVDQFLNGTKTIADVPKETTAFVQAVTGFNQLQTLAGSGVPGGTGSTAATIGVSNPPPQALIDKALTDAQGQGASAFNAEAAKAKVDEYSAALAALAKQGVTTGDSVTKLQEALTLANKAFADAVPATTAFDRGIQAQIADAAALAAVYAKGGDAVVQATAQAKAEAQARAELGANVDLQGARVKALTAEYLLLAQTQAEGQFAAKTATNNDQITFLNTEISTLGMDNDAREVLLAHLKAEQDLRNAGLPLTDAYAESYLKSVDTLTQLNQAYTQQKAALDGLASDITSAFGQVSQAITDSFLSGTGAAVNWSNVTKSVIQQVLAQALKLTILNPLLNNFLGQNLPTLGSTVAAIGGIGGGGGATTATIAAAAPFLAAGGAASGGALSFVSPTIGGGVIGGSEGDASVGSGNVFADSFGLLPATLVGSGGSLEASGSASSSGGGAMGLLSNAGSLLSVGKALFPDTFGSGSGMFSGIGESLGLTGPNGVLSGVTNFLNTPLIVSSQAGPVTSGLAAGGAGLPGTVTLGGVLGAAGAGYGLGSLAGGFVQNAAGKTGPGPQVGAALGTAIGIGAVALAPETFGASLLLGGALGGLAGGIGGGAIGSRPATPYTQETLVS